MKDDLFDKIESKTNVNRETILSLASKLQHGNFKDEKVLKEIIHEISDITGKEVSEKIISMIQNDKVPSDMEKYIN